MTQYHRVPTNRYKSAANSKASSSGGKKPSSYSRNNTKSQATNQRRPPRRILDPIDVKPINECYLQGIVIEPSIRDTRTGKMWTATIQIPNNPDPSKHAMIDVTAWDDVAIALDENYTHGDAIALLCELRWWNNGLRLNVIRDLEIEADEEE